MKPIYPDDIIDFMASGEPLYVVLEAGPFKENVSPYTGEKTTVEDTSMHGRVQQVVGYNPPWILLLPLEPPRKNPSSLGPFSVMAFGPQPQQRQPEATPYYLPDISMRQVDGDYLEAYRRYVCGEQEKEDVFKDLTPIQRTIQRLECGQCEDKSNCTNCISKRQKSE